jgi:Zn-dependent protease
MERMNIDFLYIGLVIIVILLSMTLHEAMHGFVAYWLGDDTAKIHGRLTLNPIKHIDPYMTLLLPILLAVAGLPIFGGAKPVPFNPQNVRFGEWGAALIALAGPLTNFVIAFVGFGVWTLAGSPTSGIGGELFTAVVSVNLGFFIFNMIPIPPLDGSRVLYALAPEFIRRGMEMIERYGFVVLLVIVVLGSSILGPFLANVDIFFLQLFAHVFGVA